MEKLYTVSNSEVDDKKSRVPEEEKGDWGFQGGEKDKLIFSTFLSLSHIKRFLVFFFPLNPEL